MRTRRIAAWAVAGSLGVLSLWAVLAAHARVARPPVVAEIVTKSAAARGGREAWAKVQTMVWSGHLERTDGTGPRPQFLFDQKRPNLTRFEVVVDRQRSVRVFDGLEGWKLRPDASGRPDLQPYSEEERRAALDALVIDGPVLGAGEKGVDVQLEGPDQVEGRRAYRLSAKLPSGTTERVWIDAETFLELKYDRPARDAAGNPITAEVYLRDYQAFEGLQIPFAIETRAPGAPAAGRLVIERIAINANLPEGVFARPGLRTSRRGITVDARAADGRNGPSARWSGMREPSTTATAASGGRGTAP